MIYDYFRATGAYETVQGLVALASMTVQNDDVKDFDVRWYHALLSLGSIAQVKNYRIPLNFGL